MDKDLDWIVRPESFSQRLDEIYALLDSGAEGVGSFAEEWVFASDDNPVWGEWTRSMPPELRTRISGQLVRLGQRFDTEEGWALEYFAGLMANHC